MCSSLHLPLSPWHISSPAAAAAGAGHPSAPSAGHGGQEEAELLLLLGLLLRTPSRGAWQHLRSPNLHSTTRQSRTSRRENSGAQKRWKTRNPGIQEVILAKHKYFHLRQGREKQYYQNSTWHLIQQHKGTTKHL